MFLWNKEEPLRHYCSSSLYYSIAIPLPSFLFFSRLSHLIMASLWPQYCTHEKEVELPQPRPLVKRSLILFCNENPQISFFFLSVQSHSFYRRTDNLDYLSFKRYSMYYSDLCDEECVRIIRNPGQDKCLHPLYHLLSHKCSGILYVRTLLYM